MKLENLGLLKPNDKSLTNLKYQSRPRIEPSSNEVEIGVVGTGLNFRDVLVVLGMYPGDVSVLGLECSGVVTKVGSNVHNVTVGQPVVAMVHDCFQSFVNCDSRFVYPVKSIDDLIPAATLPVTYLTAWYGLVELAKVKYGDSILVHAAAGGVGMAALQLGKHLGARTFATASSPEKQKIAKDLGAEHVYSSRVPEFASDILKHTNGKGLDIVLNSLIGEFIDQSLQCMKPHGTFLEIGKRDIRPIEAIKALKDVSYYPYDIDAFMIEHPNEASRMLAEVLKLHEAGHVGALKHHVFPWSQASDAFRFMAKAEHIGKIVITSPLWSKLSTAHTPSEISKSAPKLQSPPNSLQLPTTTDWTDVFNKLSKIPDEVAIQEIKR